MNIKRILLCGSLAAMLCANANAGSVFVSGDSNIAAVLFGANDNDVLFENFLGGGTSVFTLNTSITGSAATWVSDVDTFYDGLAGVSSTLFTGTFTSADLVGVDLFVGLAPGNDFTAAEISALVGFSQSGGGIFLLGDNALPPWPDANTRINTVLSALGSGMSIINGNVGSGIASGADIIVDPFTTGVVSVAYTAPSEVSGGNALVLGAGGIPFIAYEDVSVPEPTTLLLLGLSLAGLGFTRRLLH